MRSKLKINKYAVGFALIIGILLFQSIFISSFIIIEDEKIPAAIIRPDRTHHDKQVELISSKHIKSTFNVQDGDELEVILR